MISDFSVRVRPKNKNGVIVFLSALTVGAFLFVFSTTLESYRGIVGLAALVFIVYALYAFTKYVSPEYYYDITSGDEPMLVVRQAVGKRSTTMCRILLSDITCVKYETSAERTAHKTPADYRKCVYTLTLGVQNTVRITVNSEYEKCEVVLEASDEFASLILSYAKEARALKVDFDGE